VNSLKIFNLEAWEIMNKIVFDIETKNSFEDVGGDQNIDKLEVSVVGVYSYDQDKYFCFGENGSNVRNLLQNS